MALPRAEDTAPQQLRTNPKVRDAVGRGPGPAGRGSALGSDPVPGWSVTSDDAGMTGWVAWSGRSCGSVRDRPGWAGWARLGPRPDAPG